MNHYVITFYEIILLFPKAFLQGHFSYALFAVGKLGVQCITSCGDMEFCC